MSIKFTKNQIVKVNKETTRPVGFGFPRGLTPFLGAVANAFLTTTGGTKTIDSTNSVHAFTTSGNFKPSFTGTVEYLGIAGAGGGGPTGPTGGAGGGGGAGGLVYLPNAPVGKDTTYTITIGAGGPAAAGFRGSNTTTTIPAIVDAIGGSSFAPPAVPGGSSGGIPSGEKGIGVQSTQNPQSGGLSLGNSANTRQGGGAGDQLGKGYALSISGARVGYAGGGGGGSSVSVPHESPGTPLSIGTGAGTHGPDGPGGAGGVNRGSGGGGCTGSGAGSGGTGGSGVVFVRYITNQPGEDFFIN